MRTGPLRIELAALSNPYIENCPNRFMEKLLDFSASKVKNIGELGDESPFPDFPG